MKYTKSLKGSINFKRVLKQGNYVSSKNICIYLKRNNEMKNYFNDTNKEKTNYLGICVSKKHGNSVVRNKLKRWVREAYHSTEEKIKKGYSIVILYKKNIDVKNINYLIVKDEIRDLFLRIELFDNEK